MKKIIIDGIIGWDVSARDIRQQIEFIGNEDFTVEINSPGGLVTEGIAIFNSIKNAKGKKEVIITGIAASMGSIIALSGDTIKAHANSIYMIHNAMNFEYGDHIALRKAADISEGFSNLLKAEYVNKTGKSEKEITDMMNEETYFFGKEMVSAGFVDEIIGEEKEEKTSAILKTKAIIANANSLIKSVTNEKDFEQAAALMRGMLGFNNPAVGVEQTATGPEKKEVNKKMTEEEIKALKAEAFQAGISEEKRRVSGLKAFSGQDEETDKLVEEAIASGKNASDVTASLTASIARNAAKKVQAQENPEQVATKPGDVNALDEDDIKAMEIFGTPKDEYLRLKKGGK